MLWPEWCNLRTSASVCYGCPIFLLTYRYIVPHSSHVGGSCVAHLCCWSATFVSHLKVSKPDPAMLKFKAAAPIIAPKAGQCEDHSCASSMAVSYDHMKSLLQQYFLGCRYWDRDQVLLATRLLNCLFGIYTSLHHFP